MHKFLHLVLLLALPFGAPSPKRGGSSGSGSRGGSVGGGSRPSGGGSRPSGGVPSGGWNRPAGGGGVPMGGRPMGGGTGSFSGNSGKSGFLSSPTSRGIAAGLAGGAIAGVGTALLVNSLSSHGRYHGANGNDYYYGSRNYPNQPPAGKIVCKYEIQPNDTRLNNIWYDNTTKVKEIIYECRLNYEQCCNGLECCKIGKPSSQQKSGISWWGGLLLALAFVSIFGCIGCCIYNRVKKNANATGPDVAYTTTYAEPDPNQQQYYPQQPQASVYPYQTTYSNQPVTYPSQPTGYATGPQATYQPQQQPPSYPGYPIHTYGSQAQPYDQKYSHGAIPTARDRAGMAFYHETIRRNKNRHEVR